MPQTTVEAAAELRGLLKSEPGLTARRVAKELKVTEAWLSRRLNSNVGMKIDDYTRIRKAIVSAGASEPASK